MDRLNIIEFHKLIHSPNIIIRQIAEKMEIHKNINDNDIIVTSKMYGDSATDTFGSKRPNEVKEFYKNLIKDKINESDKCPKLKQIYKDITGEN